MGRQPPDGLAVLALGACVGAQTSYRHAIYELAITEPTVTIVVFSVVALATYLASRRVGGAYERLAMTAARISVFLVNFGFWVGSLWGDWLALVRVLLQVDAHRRKRVGDPADWVFIIGWAVALVAIAPGR